MSHQDLLTIISIIAILVGPIAAVLVTRFGDDRRAKYDRRMAVFRDLMRTRRLRLSQPHVGALNVVEIEFYKEEEVIEAWKKYWMSLNKQISNLGPQETKAHCEAQDKLLTRLLYTMAKSLKFDIEQLEILEGGYSPQSWANLEQQQQALLTLLIDSLSGNRAVPITPLVHPTPSSPYPPAPIVGASPGAPAGNATPTPVNTTPSPTCLESSQPHN